MNINISKEQYDALIECATDRVFELETRSVSEWDQYTEEERAEHDRELIILKSIKDVGASL